MRTSIEEALWVLRAQYDDDEALEYLLRSVQPSLRRFLSRVLGTSQADDVLQDVLVIVCRKLKSLHTPELFRAWVFRIASREAFRCAKKRKLYQEQLTSGSELDELPMPKVASPDDLLEELLSLDHLSAASRAVLVLHFQEELTLLEIGAILGVPVGTVKSRLAYGLTAIRKHLDEKRRK